MFDLFATILQALGYEFQSRHQLLLENLALRRTVRKLASQGTFSKIRLLRPSKCPTPVQRHWPRRTQNSRMRK
jgi:hypothetical protein